MAASVAFLMTSILSRRNAFRVAHLTFARLASASQTCLFWPGKGSGKVARAGSRLGWDKAAKFSIAGIGSRVGVSHQNHIVLFLRVLSLDPELDVDTGEAFQFGQRVGFLIQQALHDFI